MKKELIFILLQKIRTKPALKKKLAIVAMTGLGGLFLVSALTIWAGVSLFNFVLTKTSESIQTNAILKLPSELQPASCWSKTVSLMSLQPWADRPAIDNLIKLKSACFGIEPSSSSPTIPPAIDSPVSDTFAKSN